MAKILALDTSTDACSVALYLDGEVKEDFRVIPRQHTQQLLPMVQEILADAELAIADLDAIAFGRGPGSFAGIRIATGVAQGLAFAAELPLVPVSTLAAIALQQHQQGHERVIAALDARMDEVYWGAFRLDAGLPVLVDQERVDAPANVALPDEHVWHAAGSGWRYLEDMSAAIQSAVNEPDVECYPRAGSMASLAAAAFEKGDTVAPEDALPVYLRDEVAWKKKDQQ